MSSNTSGVGQVPQPPPRTVRQEVAPKGGYAPINVARNVPSTIGRRAGPLMFGTVALILWGFSRVGDFNVKRRQLKQEKRDIRLSITPLLQAEEDARFVKENEKRKQWEAEVMKDVPGWKVDEDIYKAHKFMGPSHPGPLHQSD